ncbi:hypothetical protein LSF46_25930, partial [Escherichia coli]|uniref:hypothetical protein n=1 Tax=Escherichia coli TaxID=562 RepID=UPI0021C5FE12
NATALKFRNEVKAIQDYSAHLANHMMLNDYFSKTLSIAEVKCHCNAYVTHLDFDVLSTLIEE